MNTEHYILIIIGLLLALEAWAYKDTDPHSPLITTVVRKYARKYPVLVFAAGVLAGHFFWCP